MGSHLQGIHETRVGLAENLVRSEEAPERRWLEARPCPPKSECLTEGNDGSSVGLPREKVVPQPHTPSRCIAKSGVLPRTAADEITKCSTYKKSFNFSFWKLIRLVSAKHCLKIHYKMHIMDAPLPPLDLYHT